MVCFLMVDTLLLYEVLLSLVWISLAHLLTGIEQEFHGITRALAEPWLLNIGANTELLSVLDHVQDFHTELLGLGVAVGGQGGRGTALGLGRGVWHHGVDVGCRPVTVLYVI